jgi:hypothetical protein
MIEILGLSKDFGGDEVFLFQYIVSLDNCICFSLVISYHDFFGLSSFWPYYLGGFSALIVLKEFVSYSVPFGILDCHWIDQLKI